MRANRLFRTCFLRCSQAGLVIAGVFILFGCHLPADDLPACLPADLLNPVTPLAPGHEEVIDTLSPLFVWDWEAECNPQEFLVEVFNPAVGMPVMLSERVAGTSRVWDMPGNLQPGNTYAWRVTPYIGGAAGAAGGTNTFMTGPDCSDPGAGDYPAPALLAPPDGTEITELSPIHTTGGLEWPSVSVPLAWDDPSLCNPEGYQIQVSTSPSFSDAATLDFGETEMTSVLFYFPPGVESFPLRNCTLYYWHVRPVLRDHVYGPWSETWSFFVRTGGLICDVIPVITPEIPLPVPPLTATTAPPPTAHGTQNANCRSGPGTVFSITGALYQGQSARIIGRSEDNSWWLIDNPAGGSACWVWAGSVEASGDLTSVQVVAAPPTPKPPSEPPPGQQDGQDENGGQDGGQQQQGCWIIDNQHPNGYCAPRPCGPKDYPGKSCTPK